ncbi:MAG: ABC transporter permease [Myxococcota bacterium]
MIRLIRREIKGLSHRIWIIVFAVALGVAATTAVHALAESIQVAIQQESRPMMAGDLVARSMHTFPEDIFKIQPEAQSQTIETLSMAASTEGQSILVEVKAVSPSYPHYGTLEIRPSEARTLLNEGHTVLVEEGLLRRLSVEIGEQLTINGASFEIAGVIINESDRMNVSLNAGPRVMLSLSGLERAKLVQFGSRITRRIQWKSPDQNDKSALVRQLNELQVTHPNIRIQSTGETSNAQRSIQNTEQFLSLVGLLALLIGLIGVAQAVTAWLSQQRQTIATYRCLGLTQRELFQLYLSTVAVMVCAGALLGIVLAWGGLQVLFSFIEHYLPMKVSPQLSPRIALEGGGLGIVAALVVSAFPLRQNTRISPLAALRADVQAVPMLLHERGIWALGISLMVWSLSIVQAKSVFVGSIFFGVIVMMTFLLLWGAHMAARYLGAIKVRSWQLRHALSAFRRPSLGLSSAMVALGLGVTIVASISLLQTAVQSQIQSVQSTRAPTNFVIDIQPDQWTGVDAMLKAAEAKHQQSAPVVMARLSQINGQNVSDIIKDLPDADRWSFTREQRLTYDQSIDPRDVISGEFGQLEANNELCMEMRYADRLGVSVGDRLVFDVQGIPLEFQLTAIRRIRWESMNINFFLVGEKEFLLKAPQNRIAAAQLNALAEEKLQSQLVQEFPNVTVISLRAALARVMSMLNNLNLAIQGMGVVSVVMGLLILIGAIRNTAEQRRKQIKLLHTIGVTKTEYLQMLSLEFGLLGVISAVLGLLGALTLTSLILMFVFRLDLTFNPLVLASWLFGLPILTAGVGRIIFRRMTTV